MVHGAAHGPYGIDRVTAIFSFFDRAHLPYDNFVDAYPGAAAVLELESAPALEIYRQELLASHDQCQAIVDRVLVVYVETTINVREQALEHFGRGLAIDSSLTDPRYRGFDARERIEPVRRDEKKARQVSRAAEGKGQKRHHAEQKRYERPTRTRRGNGFDLGKLEIPEAIPPLVTWRVRAQLGCFGAAPPRNYDTYLTKDKVEALRGSGITALSMNMVSGEVRLRGVESMFLEAQKMIGEWDSFVAEHADVFTKVTDMSALRAVKRSGKVGFIYNFQISAPFGWDLTKLDVFPSMGVRQIQLTGGRRNFLADSCWEPTNAGLSQFGYEVIHAFADKGILVDLSHVGERSALDAIQASSKPTIFSHSGCLALCPHPRNVSDRNIKAMAERGGVFCVYNQSGWLTKDPVISMDHFVAYIDHVIRIAGEDHVGFGSDQDPVDMTAMRPDEVERHQASFDRRRKDYPQLDWDVKHMRVPELSHPMRLLHLAEALQRTGHKTTTIEKILGGNYVRVFEEVVG